jgi:SWI/SNF-related matrix-associated actin-dependent regulator of chromatin subfamily A3
MQLKFVLPDHRAVTVDFANQTPASLTLRALLSRLVFEAKLGLSVNLGSIQLGRAVPNAIVVRAPRPSPCDDDAKSVAHFGIADRDSLLVTFVAAAKPSSTNVLDLTDEPTTKVAAKAAKVATSSSSSAASSAASKKVGSRVIDLNADDDEEEDEEEEDEHADDVLLCVIDFQIKGVQYYRGTVSNGQAVSFQREPQNPYDRNAIQVLNLVGTQVGHAERDAALLLAPLVDSGQVTIEGMIMSGANNVYAIPVSCAVFGKAADKEAIKKRLARFRPRDSLNAPSEVRRSVSANSALSSGKGSRMSQLAVPTAAAAQIDVLMSALQSSFAKDARAEQPIGIRTKLFPHQLMWLHWARQHEESALGDKVGLVSFEKLSNGKWFDRLTNTQLDSPPPPPGRGGILADEMGLGKTLQVLALIVDDIARSGDVREPTLIVVPMAVLSVWERQVLDHVDADKIKGGIEVIRFHGANRGQYKTADLQRANIVVTTYDIVRATYNKNANTASGPLFAVQWRRVVLDEAHTIKNAAALTHKSCLLLKTERRWALTGTPIVNKIEDFLALVAFLRIISTATKEYFKKFYIRPIKDGNFAAFERLQLLVKLLVLRRTKESRIDGQPIITLPPANYHVVLVPLRGEASAVYQTLFKAARREIDLMRSSGKQNDVLKNYSHILVILLRLRQAALSLSLLPDAWRQNAVAAAEALVGSISAKLTEKDKKQLESGVSRMRDMMQQNELSCIICLDDLREPVMTICSHFFCRACLKGALAVNPTCPMCREPVNEKQLVDVKLADGAVALNLPEPAAAVVDSGKVDAFVAMLRASMHLPRAQRKTVVFSQFPTVFKDLVPLLESELGLACGVIEGSVSAGARIALIDRFRVNYAGEDPIDCMFVSLKAGGVGIDLSAARSVYLLDSWWNRAVEEQAIARVHRLGALHSVEIVRLVAEDSIEQNIMALQAAKELSVAEAFGGKSNEQLREERLKLVFNLFGDPVPVAGAERLDDRIKEIAAIPIMSADAVAAAPAASSGSSVGKPPVLNLDDNDGDAEADTGIGSLIMRAPSSSRSKGRKAQPKKIERAQTMPEPRKRSLYDEPLIVTTKRARKANVKYTQDYDLEDEDEAVPVDKDEEASASVPDEDDDDDDDVAEEDEVEEDEE